MSNALKGPTMPGTVAVEGGAVAPGASMPASTSVEVGYQEALKSSGTFTVNDYRHGSADKATGTVTFVDYTKVEPIKATGLVTILDYSKVEAIKAATTLTVNDYTKIEPTKATGTYAVLDYAAAVGQKATGTVTVVDYTKAEALKASGSITVVDYAKAHLTAATGSVVIVDYTKAIAAKAEADVTVVDYTQLAGKTLTVAGHVLTEGEHWYAETSNDVTALSLRGAINQLTEVDASRSGAVITVQATTAGAAGNSITLATGDAVNLTIEHAHLEGGQDHLVITVAGHALTQGTDFTAAVGNNETAESLKDAIHALSEVNALRSTATVDITAATAGTAGNSIALVTAWADAATVSGAVMSGGIAALVLTVGSHTLTESTDFTAETSNDVTADNIATAIDGKLDFEAADPAAAIVLAYYSTPGVAGNAKALTTSDVTAATVSGTTFADGRDATTVTIGGNALVANVDWTAETSNDVTADNLATAIDGLANFEAPNPDAAIITVSYKDIGVAGNAETTVTSSAAAVSVQQATLASGREHLTLTANGTALVQGTDFTAETSNDTTATNIATAVTGVTGLDATAALAVVNIEASTAGTAGNAITIVSSIPASVVASGATLANATDPTIITLGTYTITGGTDFVAGASNDEAAHNLATYIDGKAEWEAGHVDAVVTATYATAGTTGNSKACTSSKASGISSSGSTSGGENALTVSVAGTDFVGGSGLFLKGASNTEAAANLASAINGAALGITAAGDVANCDMSVDTAGTAGNATTLASNKGTAASNSGAVFSGGENAVTVSVAGVGYVGGTGFNKGASNTDSAHNLATAITATGTYDADHLLGVVTVSAKLAGTAGNGGALASNKTSAATVGAAALAGGTDGATITVAGHALICGTDFAEGASNNASATNLAAAINALSEVDATPSTNTVNVEAHIAGLAGNDITLVTSNTSYATRSGAKLTGGCDEDPT